MERNILHHLAALEENISKDDAIKCINLQLGYSVAQIIRSLQLLEAFGLIAALVHPSPRIIIDSVIRKYIRLNPEQFSELRVEPKANAVLH
jgi:hypothetical protein